MFLEANAEIIEDLQKRIREVEQDLDVSNVYFYIKQLYISAVLPLLVPEYRGRSGLHNGTLDL